jgi:hypothetical protein
MEDIGNGYDYYGASVDMNYMVYVLDKKDWEKEYDALILKYVKNAVEFKETLAHVFKHL